MSEVTRLLSAFDAGDPTAAEQLLPLVYATLRKLAAHLLAAEKPGQTLQATALVHEAYLRLVGPGESGPGWGSRGHFFGAAARAMRQILVDTARAKSAVKRGGGRERVPLDRAASLAAPDGEAAVDLIALDGALDALAAEDPRKARLVELRYFAGLSVEEAAAALGVSEATAKRDWVYARSWLFGRLNAD